MKLKKIFTDFGDPEIYNNKIFARKIEGMYLYNFDKDDFQLYFFYKSLDDWYAIHKNVLVFQKKWAVWDAKSENNHIRIIKLSEEQPFIEYQDNILLTKSIIDKDYLFSSCTIGNQEFFTLFNPFTKEKKWEINVDVNKQVRVKECNDQLVVLLSDKKLLTCHSSQTGEALWSFDVSEYLMKDIPLYDDGEPIYKPSIEVLYNPVYKLVLVQLNPNKLLALDAATGVLRWLAPIVPNSDWLVDKNTGNVYLMAASDYLENYIEDDGRTRQVRQYTCIYHHIEGSTGETLLQRDLKEVIPQKHEDGTARTLNFHHFGGYKDDSLYLSLFGEGELHKLNKHTGELEESYIHDRNFESAPIIHQNRLFLTDPTANDKTRLLVFEI